VTKSIRALALISYHTSPLAPLGGYKTGGMNVYVRELARELGQRGVRVDVFTRRESDSQLEIDLSIGQNVRVIHIEAGAYAQKDPNELQAYVPEFVKGIYKFEMLHNAGYDVIYSHYWLSGVVAEKLREAWRIPVVQMFHTLGAMKNRIATEPTPMVDHRMVSEMHIIGWVDRIIAATQAEYAQLLWLYRADRRRLSIVPPGVDAAQFMPRPRDESRAAVGLKDGEKMLLFVGRLEPLKAVDSIIRALHAISTVAPHELNGVRLTIVGGEAGNLERKRLVALAEELGVARWIEFVGAKDHTQLPTYYSAAEALLMPSDYESFGMVALEAMAAGTPVIASNVGGLAYLVREGETGYLVPVRDSLALAERMRDILSDSARRDAMGQAAHALAQQYDWSHIADRLMDVFAQARAGQRAVTGLV
jgi:D-inositol-3-phosphate glycosyltransferase